MNKKDEITFIEDLITTFPEIKKEVLDEDWIGLISLQIGCFRRFTQKAIDDNNNLLALQCFKFIDDNINEVEFSIENSLTISWLGKLNFDKSKDLYNRLPKKLKTLYINLHDQYNKRSKK
jgi:hypothetical protein